MFILNIGDLLNLSVEFECEEILLKTAHLVHALYSFTDHLYTAPDTFCPDKVYLALP